MGERVQRGRLYPGGQGLYGRKPDVRYRWTGEFREPRAGEYYLSGAIIEAYRAPNDLDSRFHIAEPVRVEPVRVTLGLVG